MREPASAWNGFDDGKLANLQEIIGSIKQQRFHLETLRGLWDRMPDDVAESAIDMLEQAAAELGEVVEELEEERTSDDD